MAAGLKCQRLSMLGVQRAVNCIRIQAGVRGVGVGGARQHRVSAQ